MSLSLPCHLISTPSGRFVFVGRVPSDLACEASCQSYIEAARLSGATIAARIAAREGGTFRSLSWETEADAYAYAAALGYAVPAPVAMVAQPVQQAQARDARGPVADTITLPSHWGVYLVNGDASALDDGEAETIDAYVAEKLPAGAHVVDMIEGTDRFTWSFDLYGGNAKGGDVADFTILVPAMVPQPCQQQQADVGAAPVLQTYSVRVRRVVREDVVVTVKAATPEEAQDIAEMESTDIDQSQWDIYDCDYASEIEGDDA